MSEFGQAADSAEARADLYAQLLWVARERGYKDGWAAWKFKERVGSFPKGLDGTVPREASPALLRWVRSQMIRWAKRPGAAA